LANVTIAQVAFPFKERSSASWFSPSLIELQPKQLTASEAPEQRRDLVGL
jgi:hypothetical protein